MCACVCLRSCRCFWCVLVCFKYVHLSQCMSIVVRVSQSVCASVLGHAHVSVFTHVSFSGVYVFLCASVCMCSSHVCAYMNLCVHLLVCACISRCVHYLCSLLSLRAYVPLCVCLLVCICVFLSLGMHICVSLPRYVTPIGGYVCMSLCLLCVSYLGVCTHLLESVHVSWCMRLSPCMHVSFSLFFS